MAYTLTNDFGQPDPLRFIGPAPQGKPFAVVYNVFDPMWWVCDPCNHSSKRFEIEHANGRIEYRPWSEVVLSDDDTATVNLKCEAVIREQELYYAADAAVQEYNRHSSSRMLLQVK